VVISDDVKDKFISSDKLIFSYVWLEGRLI
jgi:hypothetical protein